MACITCTNRVIMLRVGRISYANVAPFFYFWHDAAIEFVKLPPKFLGKLASEGRIDLAPLPVFDGLRLEETFEPLGGFGIAATRKVMSVFLFSKKPIERLGGETIFLSAESSTSVALLKLLLLEKYSLYNVEFSTISSVSTYETATLMIGDKALKEFTLSGKHLYTYDLAQLWHEWTSLPFTFARWVVRKSLPSADKLRLEATISENLDRAASHLEEIAADESRRTGIEQVILLEYLRNFTFRLGPKENEGIDLFRGKLVRNGLLGSATAREA